ncbi:MAG: ABC transporter ATP-binding protein [Pseudomonadota bacterium]
MSDNPSDTPRLDLKHLTRRFGGRVAVDDVSLSIAAGQVTCLLGPSGCGKSTTLRMVAGVEQVDAGEIYVDGRLICDTRKSIPAEDRQIGLMFQDFALFPHLRVSENVGFGLTGDAYARMARVRDLLARVGMERFEAAYPHELSGGEQQRVALARALAPRPGVMLMDEPFSGLDNRLRDGIRDDTLDILRSEDTAVLLVTHEPEEAMRISDRIALMRDGSIVQEGTPEELYNQPVDAATVAFFSDINRVSGTVKKGILDTVFGPLPASTLADGTKVCAVMRQHDVRITVKGAAATVERCRFLGTATHVKARLEATGDAITLNQPGHIPIGPGEKVHLSVDPQDCFIFPE